MQDTGCRMQDTGKIGVRAGAGEANSNPEHYLLYVTYILHPASCIL